jgi:type VI secretion system protein ImpG
MIAGLLEGAAFLAARVQLKLKHEFPEFTQNLLEQLVPDYLAPTPSVLLIKATPLYDDPALRDGYKIQRGSYFDAAYREQDRQIACRFRLASEINLLPFDITDVSYFGSPAPLQGLGVPIGPDVLAGLKISMIHRSAARMDDEPSDAEALKRPELWFNGCRVQERPFHFLGPEPDAIALYEQLFANCAGVYFRYLDAFGDPVIIPAGKEIIEQIGFRDSESLFPKNEKIFTGFEWLREYFIFPRKFLGLRLTGLRTILTRLAARKIDIIFSFKELNPRLQAAATREMITLYAGAAINLFEKTTDRVPVKQNQHEYHIVPDRSRYLDYEPHRLISVSAHHAGGTEASPVNPLYSANLDTSSRGTIYYTIRRMPRLRTARENKYGPSSDYTGTDMFISLVETGEAGEDGTFSELSVKAICSNRHLTELLPVGQGGADFRLLDNVAIDLQCVAGPTKPREPLVAQLRSRSENAYAGKITWRLINLLSLNHLGLVERGAGRNAQALQETLSMFADLSDSATERRIRGLRSVDSRPIVRRIRQQGGVGVARGVEITITIDEKAYEGSGIFLLGAILDRFYCEYAGFNHFTQAVIRSTDRGEIMRWPVRTGLRRPL